MRIIISWIGLCLLVLVYSCNPTAKQEPSQSNAYLDYSEHDDKLTGGIRMIPVTTEKGTFKVWTKRVGNNPTMKVLLLHGGPGATHEYFQCFDSYLPNAGIEYYYYDQLESAFSDQPNDPELWTLERYVEEVEQVRQALGLNADNFYLMGHSWGGILGIEYALKYQQNLKGLIVTNMVSSVPAYNEYAQNVLGPQLPEEVLKEILELEAKEDYHNPRYNELLYNHYYTEHILRMPLDEWPNPVQRAFAALNYDVYLTLQGPSEFGISGNATLKEWDRSADLPKIEVPTLMMGAAFDTMDPEYMEWMAGQVQNGTYSHCPNGSHLSMYDDQDTYFKDLIQFIKEVDTKAEQ
jgi:proline iminopeptidase